MKYTEWQLINEAIGSGIPLGLRNPNIVGGPLGSTLRESPIEDDVDDEEDEDEEEDDDAEGEEDLEGDIMGGTEDDGIDPLKSFPPDNGEDMDGLPTPDEEMGGGEAPAPEEGGDVPPELGAPDEMGDTLAGIDPDLAGLGGDEAAPDLGGDVPPEIADAGPGMDMPMDTPVADIPCPNCNPDGEGLPGEGDPNCPDCRGENFTTGEGDLGALGGEEDLAGLGGEEDLGGEDLGALGGEEDLAGLGGEEDLGGEEPAPDFGGEEDLGDEDVPPEEVDAEIEDVPPEGEDKDAEMAALMAKMQDYCRKYMPAGTGAPTPDPNSPLGRAMRVPSPEGPFNQPQPNAPGSDVLKFPLGAPKPTGQPLVPMMAKKQVKFMTKGGQAVEFMAKDGKAMKFMSKDADKCGKKCNKFMDKGVENCNCESTEDEFLASLRKSAQRQQKGRRMAEDRLVQPVAPKKPEEPQAGQVGFAPQGRVGAIGGGYTMDDFKDIPVLGESQRYPTFTEWVSKKSK